MKDIELLIQTAIDVPESLEIEEIKTEIDVSLAEINKHFKNKSTKSKTKAPTASKKVVEPTKAVSSAKVKYEPKKSEPVKKIVDIRMVDHFSTEFRLIRRLYNLVRLNKTASFRKIQLVYMAFQKAALDRSIRKTSKDADLFTKINEKVVVLFDTVNPSKSDANIDFTDKELLNKMETFVKTQKVNYGITLLKSYVSLQGLKPETEKVNRLLKRIDNAIEKQKVHKDNRLYDELIKAKKQLETYIACPKEKITPEVIGLSNPAKKKVV